MHQILSLNWDESETIQNSLKHCNDTDSRHSDRSVSDRIYPFQNRWNMKWRYFTFPSLLDLPSIERVPAESSIIPVFWPFSHS